MVCRVEPIEDLYSISCIDFELNRKKGGFGHGGLGRGTIKTVSVGKRVNDSVSRNLSRSRRKEEGVGCWTSILLELPKWNFYIDLGS